MITPIPEGVIIDVRVIPRAARSGLAGTRRDSLLVRLHAPPVEGAANTELIEVLSEAFGVPRRTITIIAGERSRSKRVRLDGMSVELVRSKIQPYDPHL